MTSSVAVLDCAKIRGHCNKPEAACNVNPIDPGTISFSVRSIGKDTHGLIDSFPRSVEFHPYH